MYQFKRTQLVKTDLHTCWDFFSSPKSGIECQMNYIIDALSKFIPGWIQSIDCKKEKFDIYHVHIVVRFSHLVINSLRFSGSIKYPNSF